MSDPLDDREQVLAALRYVSGEACRYLESIDREPVLVPGHEAAIAA